MKKLVLITALIAASAVAVPAMPDNGQHHKKAGVHQDASNHKYVTEVTQSNKELVKIT